MSPVKRVRWKHDGVAAWGFLMPNFVGFMVFTVFAVAFSLWLSWHSWDLFSSPRNVGMENYVRLLTQDPNFWRTLKNTAVFVVGVVPLGTAVSLGIALLANRALKGIALFRTILYMPSVTSTIAVGIVWMWLLEPQYGVVNWLLRSLGWASPPEWLFSTVWAKPALVLMEIWHYAGYYMVIFLAGLQAIPAQLYEAAEIDGASRWRSFLHVTLPLLSPTTFFVLVIRTINAFQIFEQPYIMTEGGPAGATETLVYYIYKNGFEFFRMGYASAVAWVLFIIIFILTYIQFRYQGRWVHYE